MGNIVKKLMMAAVLYGREDLKVQEVPVHHRPRVAGVSKYGVWNRLGRGAFDLLALAWYQKRRLHRVDLVESDQEARH